MSELVVKGAGVKLEEAREAQEDERRRRALRERFLEGSRRGAGVDLDVALKVRDSGWIEP